MKRMIIVHAALAALLAGLLAGCSVDTPGGTHVVLTGGEQFKTYVALGGAMTAGFMDGGLLMNGQLGSYPSLIARQMGASVAVSRSATFTQPYVAFPGIGSTPTGDPAVTAGVLYWNGTSITLRGTTPTASVPALALMATLPAPYNNLGVPGATLQDVHTRLTASDPPPPSPALANSFFNVILRNPTFGNVTQRDQATGKKPTLLTVWVGVDELTGAARTGGPALGVNILPPASFGALFDSLLANARHRVAALAGLPPLLVVGNIPEITNFPYFVAKARFDATAAAYSATLTYTEDAATVSYVLFPALSLLQPAQPLTVPASLTLTGAEVDVLATAVAGFNAQIATACDARGARLVDLHDLFDELATGSVEGLTGGHFLFGDHAAPTTAYSLDGLNVNNRGQGLVANAFLDTINDLADTSLPHVDVESLTWDPSYAVAAAR